MKSHVVIIHIGDEKLSRIFCLACFRLQYTVPWRLMKLKDMFKLYTFDLKITGTIKINYSKITTYFWYLWTFLILLQITYFNKRWASRWQCNHFSQSLNFELKIFLDINFMTKIGSRGLWIHFLPKNQSKWPKDQNQNVMCTM